MVGGFCGLRVGVVVGLNEGARMEDFEGLRIGNFWDLHVGAIEGTSLGAIDGILVGAAVLGTEKRNWILICQGDHYRIGEYNMFVSCSPRHRIASTSTE